MEYLARLVGALCILVVSMGLLYGVGNFPATEKVIKFVMAIYILVSVLKTAGSEKISFKPKFDFNADISYETSENFDALLIEQTQKDMEKLIVQRLTEKNISYNFVDVHILEQNNLLSMDKIVIGCNAVYTRQAEECIQDLLSENTQVIIGETDSEN